MKSEILLKKIIKNRQKELFHYKIDKFFNKYDSSLFIIIKYFYFLVIQLFANKNFKIKPSKTNNREIAICIGGGIGDIIYRSIFIKEFAKQIKNESIKIVLICNIKKMSVIQSIFYNNYYIFDIRDEKKFNRYDYLIALRLEQYPQVLYYNHQLLKKYDVNLLSVIEKYLEFEFKNPEYFTNRLSSYYTKFCLLNIIQEKKLVQSADYYDILRITRKHRPNIYIKSELYDFLKDFSLFGKKYITLTRDVDSCHKYITNNVRLWKLEYFKELIVKIKERYPDVKIVQIGAPRGFLIEGVDVNLLGKTNFEQLKIVLKNSILHIDGECGMVHLKHYLNGVSAVLFGQTSIDFKGYDNNINLKSNGCPHWCEWIVNDWQTHCIRGYKQPPCMTELKPEYVFENIVPYLDNAINRLDKQFEIKKVNDLGTYFENNVLSNKKIVFYGKEFYKIAKIINKNNNQITIYDSKLNNEEINKAKDLGILMEYGDIYNIPEENDSIDIVVYCPDKVENNEFALREIKRISDSVIIQ